MSVRVLVILWFVLLFAGPLRSVSGQGFNTYNGRNHPELDWQVAETEHFQIMYPAHLAGIEVLAAPIAEETYRVLSSNLNVTFDERIRIYLSNEDEIANGFAVSIGNGYTQIWVEVNDVAEVWTGKEKWLRKVISHELTHIFHYRAVRSNLGFYAYLFGNPLPRFWAEGLAQYETEDWDAQRGDRWLRTAVLDDKLSYNDAGSIWNGRLLYAVGNAQVRYFVSEYGDSTLARLLAHRKKVLFGLGEVHDFDHAFEKVTGKSYRTFYERWRRDMNIYYNTLAGQLEPPDSLAREPLRLPGQYVYDVQYSPDTSIVAVLSLAALDRPVRRLYVVDLKKKKARIVAEGSIKTPISWSPDGKTIAYARTRRGKHGSLVNDLFVVDRNGNNRRRLTTDRRAISPVFAPDSTRPTLAFVGIGNGTANIYDLDPTSGRETQLTHYTGDVQISSLAWSPDGSRLAYALFDTAGLRRIVVLDRNTGTSTTIGSEEADNRQPVWNPAGTGLAFTSLRDDVPNVFVADLETGRERRLTAVSTGASAVDWIQADSLFPNGSLVVTSGISKERDRAYRIDVGRTVPPVTPVIPDALTGWTQIRPVRQVPSYLTPDSSLITNRYSYHSWRNVTHVASLVLPYYDDPHDWGVLGFTSWTEPLGKHLFTILGGISFDRMADNSFFAGSYVNNQLYPTIAFSGYRLPGRSGFYGDEMLFENLTGGDVSVFWPLDWGDRPFVDTRAGFRLRFTGVDPLDTDRLEWDEAGLPEPRSGRQADLRLAFMRTKQRPYRYNVIHPLDGLGVRILAEGAGRLLGADTEYLRGDVAAYGIFRAPGLQRLFLYGRAQIQTGNPLPQDYVGLSRYDDVRIGIPELIPFSFGDAERVRGFRDYVLGDHLVFGSAEYRIPVLPDLQTRLLGVVSLGATTLSVFMDAAAVWTGVRYRKAEQRVGAGLELKNALRVGAFELMHAVGVAQPASRIGESDDYDLYYRISTAVPF